MGGEATRGHQSPPQALGAQPGVTHDAHAGAHGCREGISPTGASVRVGVSGPPPEGTALHWVSSDLSEKRLPVPEGSLSPHVPGWTQKRSRGQWASGSFSRLFWESSASPISWCSQGPPASTRKGTLSATGREGRQGQHRSSREGGRMAGRAERRRGPPRCGEGRGWLRCWAGAHSASRLRQRRVPCWYLRASWVTSRRE